MGVPKDTLFLTKKGWRTHEDIQINDLIMTYNDATDEKEWAPLLKKDLIIDPFVSEIQNQKNVYFKCSPDDIICIRRKRRKNIFREDRRVNSVEWIHKLIRLKEMLNHDTDAIMMNAPLKEYPKKIKEKMLNSNVRTAGDIYNKDYIEYVTNMSNDELDAFVTGFVISQKSSRTFVSIREDRIFYEPIFTAMFLWHAGHINVITPGWHYRTERMRPKVFSLWGRYTQGNWYVKKTQENKEPMVCMKTENPLIITRQNSVSISMLGISGNL